MTLYRKELLRISLTGVHNLRSEFRNLLFVSAHESGVVQHFVDLGAILDLLRLASEFQSRMGLFSVPLHKNY